MATLLRSLKFVRRLNVGSGRRLGYTTIRNLDTGNSNYARTRCLAALPSDRNYVTRAAQAEYPSIHGQDRVDVMLNEIDQKIKMHVNVYKTDVEGVLEAATRKGSLSTTQALLLIRCCGEFLYTESTKTRKSLVNEVWQLIESQQVPIDVSHYNALLLVNLENETDFSPSEILLDMKKKNIEPNRVTFQRLIEQYCTKGDIAGATKVLEHMSEQGLPINENIFNSLIKGHSEAGDVANAVKVLDIMSKSGIEPSSRTYAAVLCAHAKIGDMESIRSTLNDCKSKEIQLSDKEILQIIYVMAINDHHDLIDEMIHCLMKGVTYNRDVILAIYRLVEKHQEDVAYRLLKTMIKTTKTQNTETFNSGSFFLKKMISCDSKPETVVKYCKLMVKENINSNPYEVAVYSAFLNNMHHLAPPLMEAWKETGAEMREHYFYPIFVSYSKSNNLQGILNTMKSMIFDFNITPSIMTVKEYIVPYMVDEPLNNATTLASNNLPFMIAANAILCDLLMQSKTYLAHQFMKQTRMPFRSGLLKRPLVISLLKTNDVKAFVNMLHIQYCRMLNNENDKNDDEGSDDLMTPKKFVNELVLKAVTDIPSYNKDMIANILNGLLEKGIGLEVQTVERIKNHLGSQLSPEIEQTLTDLTGDLEVEKLKIDSNDWVARDGNRNKSWNENKVRRDIQNLEEKASGAPEFKMILIQNYAKLRDTETVDKLMKELEEANVEYTVGFCACMIDYFSKLNQVEDAKKWFENLKRIDPNASMDKAKILNYAVVLVKNKMPEEALAALDTPIHDADSDKSLLCEKLFISLSENCPDQLETFFAKLKEKNLLENITAFHLGPIIKKYIDSGEYDKAIEKFQWACEKFNLTPQKNVLMKHLIEKEDAKALQRVTDLCTQVYGEVSALFDLAVAFFECDRIRQARKILETPGLLLRKTRIMYTADRYSAANDTEKLEKFVNLLSGLYMNMDPLYTELLKQYEKRGDWQKCLALWTQMQEDNIQPSETFMQNLEKILRKHKQAVPFARSRELAETELDAAIHAFHNLIVEGNFEKAEEYLEKLPEEELCRHEVKLAEAYISEGNLPKALRYMKTFLNRKDLTFDACEFAIENIIRHVVEKGDFDTMVDVVKTIETSIAKNTNIKFAPYIHIANKVCLETGKFPDYIAYLDKLLDDKSKVETVNKLYHTTQGSQGLLENTEAIESFKKFAYKALEANVHGPINSLWVHYFLENDAEGEKIWEEHLKNSPIIHIISNFYTIKDRGAWDRMVEFSEKMAQTPNIHPANKQRSYNAILRNILNSEYPNKYELSYEVLRLALQAIPIRYIQGGLLQKIKDNLPPGLSVEPLLNQENQRTETAADTAAVNT